MFESLRHQHIIKSHAGKDLDGKNVVVVLWTLRPVPITLTSTKARMRS